MTDLFDSGPKPLIADGLDITTATSTLTIPIGWGTNVAAPNLVVVTGVVHNGGDGSKGSGKGGGGPYYTAYLQFALGLGTSSALANVFQGNSTNYGVEYGGANGGWLASVNGEMFFGSATQTPWSGWSGSYVYAASFGYYRYLSYIALPRYNIGGGPVPPNFNFLIEWDTQFFAPYSRSWRGGSLMCSLPKGADPGLVLNDMINGPTEQGRGFPGITLDQRTVLTAQALTPGNDSTFQTWCWANSVHFSPMLRDAANGGDILDRWSVFLQYEIGFWDGMLKILPRGDTSQSANGVTFVPNITPVATLTTDDFITDDTEQPIKIDIKNPDDCFNIVRLEVTDDRNGFSPEPVEQRDETDIFLNGGIQRIQPTVQAHEVTDALQVAPLLCQLILQRGLHFNLTFTFKLAPYWGALLTPMDCVTLTDVASGCNGRLVRILSIEPDTQEVLTVTAENMPIGAATGSLYGGTATGAPVVDSNVSVDPVNPPVIFEAPSSLISPATLVLAISGGYGDEADPLWGGCYIFGSVGGGAYEQLGQTSAGPAATGKLTATLALFAGANPDTTDTLTVELNESGQALASVSSATAAAYQSLCYVDGELIAYTTATLISVNIDVVEQITIPQSPGPYTITAKNAADWVDDVSIAYDGGATLTLITSGTPATGQYRSLGSGSYQMAAGDAGKLVDVTYQRSAPAYQLTGLYRGLYGTSASAHAAGTHFAFLGNAAPVKITIPAGYIGQTVDFKFQSFNQWGNGLQDLSTCTVYPVAIAGAGFGGGSGGVPTVPTGLTVTGGTESALLAWNANPQNDNVTSYKLWRASGSGASFSAASLVWQGTALVYTDPGLAANTAYTWFLEAVNAIGVSGPTAGVSATTATGATPQTAYLETTEAIADGAFVNVYPSGGAACVRKADATIAGRAASGYVLTGGAVNTFVTVYFTGINTKLSGLTPGSPYWLGTSGGVTGTPVPSAFGDLSQPLGQAVSATAMTFQLQTGTTA